MLIMIKMHPICPPCRCIESLGNKVEKRFGRMLVRVVYPLGVKSLPQCLLDFTHIHTAYKDNLYKLQQASRAECQ